MGDTGEVSAVVHQAKSIVSAARTSTGMSEVDNVLGGGVVAGSLILLSGDPGIGKSTLVLQLTNGFATQAKRTVLYVCGEESPEQINGRINRLGLATEHVMFIPESAVESVRLAIKKHTPCLVVVDSIQTMYDASQTSERGSVTQIRTATAQLLDIAKKTNIPIIIIGHVTKDGSIAGPKSLEHLVDVVLSLEGDNTHAYRLLRSVKNRFGPTNYVGVFEMVETGLREVVNPAELFMQTNATPRPGSAITMITEGVRPFLVEMQSLTNQTSYGYPKRATSGFALSRLELLLAVLSRRAGLALDKQDVFLNVVGGLHIKDRSVDLAVCLSIASSLSNQVLPEKVCVLGEVGLGGEIRPIPHAELRVHEAARLGYAAVYMPTQPFRAPKNITIKTITDVSEALGLLGIRK